MSLSGLKTSELVEAIKRRAFLPNAQNALTDDDIIKFLNEEMYDSITPMIMAVKEDYLVTSQDVPLTANKDKYVIPYRAVGQKVRDIKYKDTQGNLYSMTRIEPEDRHYFQGTSQNRFKTFYFEGNTVVLFPGVGESPNGSLSLLYYLRPNKLVDEDRVSTILGINTTTGVITVNTVPSNISSGSNIDFLQNQSGHRNISFDVPVLGVTATTITVDPAKIPSELIVQDFIGSAGECIYPQIPSELHSILVERAVMRCMTALGDQEGLTMSAAKVKEIEDKAYTMIDNRSEGNQKKINNLNSIIRYAKIPRRRYTF